MLELVSGKGEARSERQSSWPSAVVRAGLARHRNYARLAFAGFVLLHAACEAYRAATDGTLPEPGLEAAPWFVAAVLLAVWLPFLLLAAAELRAPRRAAVGLSGQQRALALMEPVALCAVLAFTLLHVAELAWPLLSGAQIAVDVRPALTARLSTTRGGLPLNAGVALGGVGAASFYAVRQAQKALPGAARVLVALGVLAYLLGSYAVIRVASGTILP